MILLMLLLSPVMCLFVNVCVYVVSIHITRNIKFSIFFGICVGIVAQLVFYYNNFSHEKISIYAESLVLAFFTYLALSFCYWAFLNLNMTSLRIRIVRELLKCNILSTEAILELYSPQELIERRIQRLIASGQIALRDGKWFLLSKKLVILSLIIVRLRKLIIPLHLRVNTLSK